MKFTLPLVASFGLLLASILVAQQATKDSSNTKTQRETTVTGCLNKGSGPAQYVLTDQNTGNKTPVTGTTDLEQHAANHTVKLTGNTTIENGRAMFTATKVEHISATCSAPGENNK